MFKYKRAHTLHPRPFTITLRGVQLEVSSDGSVSAPSEELASIMRSLPNIFEELAQPSEPAPQPAPQPAPEKPTAPTAPVSPVEPEEEEDKPRRRGGRPRKTVKSED